MPKFIFEPASETGFGRSESARSRSSVSGPTPPIGTIPSPLESSLRALQVCPRGRISRGRRFDFPPKNESSAIRTTPRTARASRVDVPPVPVPRTPYPVPRPVEDGQRPVRQAKATAAQRDLDEVSAARRGIGGIDHDGDAADRHPRPGPGRSRRTSTSRTAKAPCRASSQGERVLLAAAAVLSTRTPPARGVVVDLDRAAGPGERRGHPARPRRTPPVVVDEEPDDGDGVRVKDVPGKDGGAGRGVVPVPRGAGPCTSGRIPPPPGVPGRTRGTRRVPFGTRNSPPGTMRRLPTPRRRCGRGGAPSARDRLRPPRRPGRGRRTKDEDLPGAVRVAPGEWK